MDQKHMIPGRYAIFVNSKGTIERDDLPEVVVLDIRTPDAQILFGLRADTVVALNFGHVADIMVDRNDGVTLKLVAGVTPFFMVRGESNCTYDTTLTKEHVEDIIARFPLLQYTPR